jgi:hypothetical protein
MRVNVRALDCLALQDVKLVHTITKTPAGRQVGDVSIHRM